MPATYEPIANTTVSGSSTTVINFNSIPSTYTDLLVIADIGALSTTSAIRFRFNGDSAANYAYVQLHGTGSSAALTGTKDQNQVSGLVSGALSTNDQRATFHLNVMQYKNTNMYKETIGRGGRPYQGVAAVSVCNNVWTSLSAITSIAITPDFSGSIIIPAGSTFSLYGIQAAA